MQSPSLSFSMGTSQHAQVPHVTWPCLGARLGTHWHLRRLGPQLVAPAHLTASR